MGRFARFTPAGADYETRAYWNTFRQRCADVILDDDRNREMIGGRRDERERTPEEQRLFLALQSRVRRDL